MKSIRSIISKYESDSVVFQREYDKIFKDGERDKKFKFECDGKILFNNKEIGTIVLESSYENGLLDWNYINNKYRGKSTINRRSTRELIIEKENEKRRSIVPEPIINKEEEFVKGLKNNLHSDCKAKGCMDVIGVDTYRRPTSELMIERYNNEHCKHDFVMDSNINIEFNNKIRMVKCTCWKCNISKEFQLYNESLYIGDEILDQSHRILKEKEINKIKEMPQEELNNLEEDIIKKLKRLENKRNRNKKQQDALSVACNNNSSFIEESKEERFRNSLYNKKPDKEKIMKRLKEALVPFSDDTDNKEKTKKSVYSFKVKGKEASDFLKISSNVSEFVKNKTNNNKLSIIKTKTKQQKLNEDADRFLKFVDKCRYNKEFNYDCANVPKDVLELVIKKKEAELKKIEDEKYKHVPVSVLEILKNMLEKDIEDNKLSEKEFNEEINYFNSLNKKKPIEDPLDKYSVKELQDTLDYFKGNNKDMELFCPNCLNKINVESKNKHIVCGKCNHIFLTQEIKGNTITEPLKTKEIVETTCNHDFVLKDDVEVKLDNKIRLVECVCKLCNLSEKFKLQNDFLHIGDEVLIQEIKNNNGDE